MKKALTIIATLFVALQLSAQSAQVVTYEIDPIQKDSFFLVETITTEPSATVPRPQTTTSSQLFKGPEYLDKFLDALATEAKKAREEASKQVATAERIDKMAAEIEKAAQDHRAFLGIDKKDRKKQKP